MRKRSALFTINLCFLFLANAQLKWGANAGVNISSITKLKGAFNPEPLVTFQFSGFTMIPLGKSFVLKPSLGYRGKGYRFDYRLYADSPSVRVKWRYDYLQLSAPIVLRCNNNDNYKLYAGGGLYAAYLINVKRDGSGVPLDYFRRFDLGINFSIALTIGERWIIDVASDLGSSADKYSSSQNISSGITLGYFIN